MAFDFSLAIILWLPRTNTVSPTPSAAGTIVVQGYFVGVDEVELYGEELDCYHLKTQWSEALKAIRTIEKMPF